MLVVSFTVVRDVASRDCAELKFRLFYFIPFHFLPFRGGKYRVTRQSKQFSIPLEFNIGKQMAQISYHVYLSVY